MYMYSSQLDMLEYYKTNTVILILDNIAQNVFSVSEMEFPRFCNKV